MCSRYWSLEQMIAHHTLGSCNLRPGDMLGTGTISSPVRLLPHTSYRTLIPQVRF